MTVWIGIDPGEKRIGMARSDPLGMLAQPAGTAHGVEQLLAAIRALVESHGVEGVVVGLPLNMTGTLGPIGMRSLSLVKRLRRELALPVLLWDERLTTRHASAVAGKQGGKHPIDERAAAFLLQGFLDAGRPTPADPPEMADAKEL